MAGEGRVVPMLDRLRLDRRRPAGCRGAAEDVVVPGEIAGVVLAEAEIGLDERLGGVTSMGKRRIDAVIPRCDETRQILGPVPEIAHALDVGRIDPVIPRAHEVLARKM